MSERLLKLTERIRDELAELEQLVNRAREAWRRAQQSGDDFYLDSVALNLHSFYAGLERLFELIATVVDRNVPQGTSWHQLLLQQMATEIPPARPAVISDGTRDLLDAYRGFRHVVRNVYTLRFDPVKIQPLVEKAPAVFAQVRRELLAFARFLEQQVQAGKEDG